MQCRRVAPRWSSSPLTAPFPALPTLICPPQLNQVVFGVGGVHHGDLAPARRIAHVGLVVNVIDQERELGAVPGSARLSVVARKPGVPLPVLGEPSLTVANPTRSAGRNTLRRVLGTERTGWEGTCRPIRCARAPGSPRSRRSIGTRRRSDSCPGNTSLARTCSTARSAGSRQRSCTRSTRSAEDR